LDVGCGEKGKITDPYGIAEELYRYWPVDNSCCEYMEGK